jgi:glycosyltransferase involved in cell wall biosynthesis
VGEPVDALRVLFVVSGEAGGAEYALATHLRNRPDWIEARVLLLAPGPAAELFATAGLEVAAGALGSPIRPRAMAAFARRVAAELRSARPAVVHATGIRAALACAPACRLLQVPLVWHKVDLAFDRRLAGPLAWLTSGVVAVSAAAAAAVPTRRLLGIVPAPVGLDSGFVVSAERPPATIGSIGRLVAHKGHGHVIEAAARLLPSHPHIRVLIAGAPVPYEANEKQRLHELAEQLGMRERVELLGHVDPIENVLERLTILVGATYDDGREGSGFEGLGSSLIEANWAGLPVVATRGGGTPEAVVDGVTGILVPPSDPAALADAIERYLGNPDAARGAGRAGAAFAREHFAPAEVSPRLFESLARIARPPRRRPLR